MKKQISPDHQKRLDSLACYLRELRLNENLRQKEVEAGVHPNTLSRMENSKNFTLITLFEICDFYGIQPSELLSII